MIYNLKKRKDFEACIVFLVKDICSIMSDNIEFEGSNVLYWHIELKEIQNIYEKFIDNKITYNDVQKILDICEVLNIEVKI